VGVIGKFPGSVLRPLRQQRRCRLRDELRSWVETGEFSKVERIEQDFWTILMVGAASVSQESRINMNSSGLDPSLEYRPIPGFAEDRLLAASDGSVWAWWGSWKRKQTRIFRKTPKHTGVVVVDVRIGDTCLTRTLASLVLRAFVGPPAAGEEALHVDLDRANNEPGNLRWAPIGTSRKGRAGNPNPHWLGRGESSYMAKLTEALVVEARRLYADERWTVAAIALHLGMSQSATTNAVMGRTWAHVPGAVPMRSPCRLTESKVREIRRLALLGASRLELSRQFGVHPGTVGRVIRGRAWRHAAAS